MPVGYGPPTAPTVTVTVAGGTTGGQVSEGCPPGPALIPVGELPDDDCPVGPTGTIGVGGTTGGRPGAVPVGPGPKSVPVGNPPEGMIPVGMGMW